MREEKRKETSFISRESRTIFIQFGEEIRAEAEWGQFVNKESDFFA